VGTLVREAELVEKLVNAPKPQVDVPFLLSNSHFGISRLK
jgi:hypothetical protein